MVRASEGRYPVYDFSSALNRPNRLWFFGRLRPTGIYEMDLVIEPVQPFGRQGS